ncbi:uncharacterized protein [Watersipora subatra]|uniref:uncharacterized protein n=1 Tax=Watersipora subatra TaxID=2589382 RepID=UPI00355C6CF2
MQGLVECEKLTWSSRCVDMKVLEETNRSSENSKTIDDPLEILGQEMVNMLSEDKEVLVKISEDVFSYLKVTQLSLQQIFTQFSGSNVKITIDGSQLKICGSCSLEYLATVAQSLSKAFDLLVKQQSKKSAVFFKFLSLLDPQKITELLIRANILAGWMVKNKKLSICSSTEACVSEAFWFFDELVNISYFPPDNSLNPTQLALAKQEHFSLFVERMQRHSKTIVIGYSDGIKRIEYTSTKNYRSFVCEAISCFFKSKGILAFYDYQKMLPLHYKLLNQNRDLVDQCTSSRYSEITVIKYIGIIKSSSIDLLASTQSKFKNLLESMMQQKVRVTPFCARGWHKSTHSLRQLADIDKLCQTASSVTSSLTPTGPSNHPSIQQRSTQTLGWLFEHWPFLYQYEFIYKKVKIEATNIWCLDADVDGYIIFKDYQACFDLPTGLHIICHPITQKSVHVYKMPEQIWDLQQDATIPLKNGVNNALRAVSRLTTVALSLVGVGSVCHRPDDAAETIFGTIFNFLSSNPICKINEILVVVDPLEKMVWEAFKFILRKIEAGVEHMMESREETITVTFAGASLAAVNEATSRYVAEAETVIGSIDWSNSPFKPFILSLQKNEVEAIKKIGKNQGLFVQVDASKGTLKLEGPFTNLECGKELINKQLLKNKAKNSISFIPDWDPTTTDIKVAVNSGTSEYMKVSQKFYYSLERPWEFEVEFIFRVQNERLLIQYEAHKQMVAKVTGKDVEKELWQLVTTRAVDSIISQEFNRSYDASAAGVSFEKNAQRAVNSNRNLSHILLAKVVTGNTCKEPNNYSSSQKRFWPSNNPTLNMSWPDVNRKNCHSSLNRNSSIVVYHDAAAYPEYVIKFKRNI